MGRGGERSVDNRTPFLTIPGETDQQPSPSLHLHLQRASRLSVQTKPYTAAVDADLLIVIDT